MTTIRLTISLAILFACTTQPKPALEVRSFCTCGPLLGQLQTCGLWEESESPEKLRPQLLDQKASPSSSCQPQDCGRLFAGICEQLKFDATAAQLPQETLESPCYCDALTIENENNEVVEVCAAWHPQFEHLLEYVPGRECQPETCSQSPFSYAPRICGSGFRAFYETP